MACGKGTAAATADAAEREIQKKLNDEAVERFLAAQEEDFASGNVKLRADENVNGLNLTVLSGKEATFEVQSIMVLNPAYTQLSIAEIARSVKCRVSPSKTRCPGPCLTLSTRLRSWISASRRIKSGRPE